MIIINVIRTETKTKTIFIIIIIIIIMRIIITMDAQVMELSDMHNPTCKLHASQSFEDHSPVNVTLNFIVIINIIIIVVIMIMIMMTGAGAKGQRCLRYLPFS